MVSDRLREIEEMGSIKMLGQQHEEIAVTLDVERISKYSLDQNIILARLASGFSGRSLRQLSTRSAESSTGTRSGSGKYR